MSVTLDTSHLEMSALKYDASRNKELMSVTPETSQDPMGPCGPLEQSAGDSFRHSLMAALSSSFDSGASVVRFYHIGVKWPGLERG